MLGAIVSLCLAVLGNLAAGPYGILGARIGEQIAPILIWPLTLGSFILLLARVGKHVTDRCDGILVDPSNRISLSRFQITCWTLLVLSALFSAGLANVLCLCAPACPNPDTRQGALDITIDPTLWGLLGLATLSAVAAPALTNRRRTGQTGQTDTPGEMEAALKTRQHLSAPPLRDGDILHKQSPKDARWIDMLNGDVATAARIDIAKLQQLLITTLVLAVYGTELASLFARSSAHFIATLPPLSTGLLSLCTISHAGYLANKHLAGT